MTFSFPGFKLFMIVGMLEILLGVLLLARILPTKRASPLARVIGGVVLIGFGIIFFSMRSTGSIVLSDGEMHLKVPFGRDQVVTAADIVSVHEVNIATDDAVRPVRRISGGELGDIRTGWFKLANGRKAFLALEDVRGLFIETTLGFPVLVGPKDFEEFEEAFKRFVYEKRKPEEKV